MLPHEYLDFTIGEVDKEKIDEMQLRDDIKMKREITQKYENLIKMSFENFDSIAEELITSILDKHREEKEKLLRSKGEELYNKQNEIYAQLFPFEDVGSYYYFSFDDFILIFCRILKFKLNLGIKIDFLEEQTKFMLSIYGNEEQIKVLAKNNGYELRLKAYALKYENYRNALQKIKENVSLPQIVSENQEVLINKDEDNNVLYVEKLKAFKYSELNVNNVWHWAPHLPFDESKEMKFQRYEKNDDMHVCNVDPNSEDKCEQCNLFRNIDKLRIIYDSVDKMIKKHYMVEEKILDYIILKRNHVDYAPKLKYQNLFKDSWLVFSSTQQMEHIFFIRNFYGEIIAYYFLWLKDLIKWLVFPSLVGLIIGIITEVLKNNRNQNINNENYKRMDNLIFFFLIVFCVLVSLWASIFLKQWEQKEQLYNFLWGTENYKSLELDREEFVPDGHEELIFGVQFPYVNQFIQKFKYFIGYLVLIVMLIFTIAIVLGIFFIKLKIMKMEQVQNKQIYVSMGIATLNAIQIKIMNYLYSFLSRKLNKWENHQKDFQSTNSLAIKLFLFDFVNCYTSIYYIAFLKPWFNDTCVGIPNNRKRGHECIDEIGLQLYTIFVINLLFNIMEIGFPTFNFFKRKKEIERLKRESNKNELLNRLTQAHNEEKNELVPHSLEYQLMCDRYEDLIYEYNEILIQLGYVFLFSVAAPFTPILIFLLAYLEKFVDTFKMFYLVQLQILDQSTGIEIYKKLIQGMIYIGILTSFGIIIVNNEFFVQQNLLYLGLEIGIFALTLFVNWNVLPKWFNYTKDINDLYYKKFYDRVTSDLPHIHIQKKAMNQLQKKSNKKN